MKVNILDLQERIYNYQEHNLEIGNENFLEDVVELVGEVFEITLSDLDIDNYRQRSLEEIKNSFPFDIKKEIDDFVELGVLKTNRLPNGEKFSKYLTKKLKQFLPYYTKGFKLIDSLFFNKFPKLYLTNDPIKIYDAYSQIQTCITPGSENSHSLLPYMVSDKIFLAYTLDGDSIYKSRTIVYKDDERKIFKLFPVYGKFNAAIYCMLEKYFEKQNYSQNFIEDYNPFDSEVYLDCRVRFDSSEEEKLNSYVLNIFENKKYKKDYCIFSGIKKYNDNCIIADICLEDRLGARTVDCVGCGCTVHREDLWDGEYCYDCYHSVWCEYCCESVSLDDFNNEENRCVWCSERMHEEEQEGLEREQEYGEDLDREVD